jgi:hypothetical protein
MPFATTQKRTDELPPAVVAMDTITEMKGHRELAIPPAFVNIVGNCPRHTRETLLRQPCACEDQTFALDARNRRKLRYEPFSMMSGNQVSVGWTLGQLTFFCLASAGTGESVLPLR